MRDPDAGRTTRALRAAGRFLLWVPWPLALLLALAWALLIWDLSSHSVPIPVRPSLFWELLSNLAHAPLFGVLTLFVAACALREREGGWPRPRRARVVLVLACVLGYGVLDEWHQGRIRGRDASALDVLTDLVSGVLVLWIVFTLGRDGLRERQLVLRLGAGVLLCLACATMALLS
jgi:VanZ family protein